MEFKFDYSFEKTLQSAAYLLSQTPGKSMKYLKLLKLLYIADRESLQESGAPITGCRPIAMEKGPLPEEASRYLRQKPMPNTDTWEMHIATSGYFASLAKDPGTGKLSRYERAKLAEVARRHERHSEFEVVDITHALPEWKKNDPGKSSCPIPIEDILEAVGRRGDLPEIMADAEYAASVSRCLKGE